LIQVFVQNTEQFLKSIYNSLSEKRDSYIELGMALASASHIDSVVELSESPLYKRKHGQLYKTLAGIEIRQTDCLKANHDLCIATCKRLSDIEVYSGDSTFINRKDAKTLKGRRMKRLSNGELAKGHETYWTMCLSEQSNSWAGVIQVERMAKDDTVSSVAGRHMKAIDALNTNKKLFVFDAGHGQTILNDYQECKHSDIVMRLKGNQRFYAPPVYKGRGRYPKHGPIFKLSKASDPLEQKTIRFKGKALRISYWRDLHYKKHSDVHGVILKLEFLKDSGEPVFKKAIWLFTTDTESDIELLAQAYLWRSSHELSFRFMKQHLALTKQKSPDVTSCDNWYQLVAIAMNLLLSIRDYVQAQARPWHPVDSSKMPSQRQTQKQALAFFLQLKSPVKPPRPAGKGLGRSIGFLATPRKVIPILRKTPKRIKKCKKCGFALAP